MEPSKPKTIIPTFSKDNGTTFNWLKYLNRKTKGTFVIFEVVFFFSSMYHHIYDGDL